MENGHWQFDKSSICSNELAREPDVVGVQLAFRRREQLGDVRTLESVLVRLGVDLETYGDGTIILIDQFVIVLNGLTEARDFATRHKQLDDG